MDTNTSTEMNFKEDTKGYVFVINLRHHFEYDFQFILSAYCELPVAIIVAFLNCTILYIFWKKKMGNVTHIMVAGIVITETVYILVRSTSQSLLGVLGIHRFNSI